jgi:hypothetical protein
VPATPWTTGEKAKIRFYLGWSARFHQFDSRLEQAMSAIEGETDDSTRDELIGVLTALDDIKTRIVDAYGRLKARVVGSITLPGFDEIGMLRSEGRRLTGQVAATLGVAVRHDVFSSSSPKSFESFDGLGGGGGGNYFKQG